MPDAKSDAEDALDAVSAEGEPHDIAGLLALAKAYRAGTAPGGRDMRKCFDTYKAAADLGSAEAEYALALFALNGGLGAQDLKEGTTRLRAAADKGSVPARIYLGNLYELGVHYKADAEKADVWYRNAARTAGIALEAGSDEHALALAKLGAVRYVLSLVESGAVDEDEKAHLLQRARLHGYNLKAPTGGGERTTMTDALESVETKTSTPQIPSRERMQTLPDTKLAKLNAELEKKERDEITAKRTAGKPSQAGGGLGAFGVAAVFVAVGLGAAYAAYLGALELLADGHPLPLLGTRIQYVFPIVFTAFGVLPGLLVYKPGTLVKALFIGALFSGAGFIAWGTGQGAIHGSRTVQAFAFGLAGYLAGLLVLGLLGGTKPKAKARSKVLTK